MASAMMLSSFRVLVLRSPRCLPEATPTVFCLHTAISEQIWPALSDGLMERSRDANSAAEEPASGDTILIFLCKPDSG
jgi:hypothetical protein